MKSMTGFGISEKESDSGKITVEARSVNHRYLDLRFQLPESASSLETDLTQIVKKRVLRGKVRVTVTIEESSGNTLGLDLKLAKRVKHSLQELIEELGIDEEVRLEHYLMIRELFSSNKANTGISEKQKREIEKTVEEAVEALDESRKDEGQKLRNDLSQRIEKIEKLSIEVESRRDEFMIEFSERVKQRLAELLQDKEIDQTRFNQEIAYLAEKSDITEEIVRLKAHTGKFRQTIEEEGSVGKELNFLLQEMNREAGTISAKSKDAGISHATIEIRSEIEKMREQVQNIE